MPSMIITSIRYKDTPNDYIFVLICRQIQCKLSPYLLSEKIFGQAYKLTFATCDHGFGVSGQMCQP